MNKLKASAFAPGHISGFFEPIIDNNILKTGSRGAGINISLGATSEVIVESSDNTNFKLFVNDKESNFPLIPMAFEQLIGENKMNITVKTKLDLPLSQGFGMSAASVLSASYAFSKIIKKPIYEAIKASHIAEVYHKTGLGDVISSSFGGVEIRTKPGLPPWGVINHIIGNFKLVLCIIDKSINTKDILTNEEKIKIISKYGDFCTNHLKQNPTIENLINLSKLFTKKTNLASDKIIQAINIADKFGKSSMCMLGNSIFAIGETNQLINKLNPYGKVYLCEVNENGANIL